jgi:Domain of unkown function (DUF1775)
MSLTYSISVALLASVAVAHMVVMPEEISPGGRQTFGVTISHDCGDDTLGTTNFTVEVPRGLLSVKVEDLPGWHVIIHKYTVRVSSTSRPRAAAVHFAHSLNVGLRHTDRQVLFSSSSTPSPSGRQLTMSQSTPSSSTASSPTTGTRRLASRRRRRRTPRSEQNTTGTATKVRPAPWLFASDTVARAPRSGRH